MAWMATIGPNRACSCIIESKLFTQTKFSKNWGKTKEIIWEAPLYLFIYLFLNHEFHIWNIAILTDSCLSLFFKICYRFMTITVHHFLEMFFFFLFKKTSVFLKKNTWEALIGLGKKRPSLTPNSVIVFTEPSRRCFMRKLGCVGSIGAGRRV